MNSKRKMGAMFRISKKPSKTAKYMILMDFENFQNVHFFILSSWVSLGDDSTKMQRPNLLQTSFNEKSIAKLSYDMISLKKMYWESGFQEKNGGGVSNKPKTIKNMILTFFWFSRFPKFIYFYFEFLSEFGWRFH